MKIKNISFKNILSFGNKSTTIEFNSNEKILVSADNGSGKNSAFIEPLFFNLTGKPYRNVKVDVQLINSKNKKNLLTIGEYESDTGIKVKIERGRKPNVFNLFINGVEQDQEASKDFQKKIETILNFDSKNLDKTFIISSTTYKPFLSLNPDEKRKLIDQVIEIESFSKMADSMKKDRTLEKENLKDINYEIEKLKSNLDIIKKFNENSDIEKQKQEIENLQNKLSKLKGEKVELLKNQEQTQEKLNKLQESTNQLIQKDFKQSQAITNLKKQSYQNKAKYETLRKQFKDESLFFSKNDFCDRCKKEISLEEKQKISWEIEQKILELDGNYSDEIEKKIEGYEEQNRKLKTDIDSNQKMIKYLSDTLSKHSVESNKIKFECQHIDNQIDTLKTSISKSHTYDQKELTEKLNKKYEERIEKTDKLEIIEVSLKLLGEKYLRSYMISKYLPLINESFNKYLEIFGFSFRMILGEQFNEKMLSRDYENLSYNSLSEGEKLRVNMSLLFSFFDISKIKMKQTSNVILLDEVLDMSGDFGFLTGMNQIINNLTNDGLSCIIISHNSDLKNLIEFDKHISLKKVNGFSKIEEN